MVERVVRLGGGLTIGVAVRQRVDVRGHRDA